MNIHIVFVYLTIIYDSFIFKKKNECERVTVSIFNTYMCMWHFSYSTIISETINKNYLKFGIIYLAPEEGMRELKITA